MSEHTTGSIPPSIPIPYVDTSNGIMPFSDPSERQTSNIDNIFDRLVAQNAEQAAHGPMSPTGISHPSIFRKGTLIEIPDVEPRGMPSGKSRRRDSDSTKTPLPERFVAIAIKDCEQTDCIISWSIQKILVPNRDKV
ncbi:hypothetical protein EC988_007210, partial [Linderina pennispora]